MKNIEPLRNCKELIYFEVFDTPVKDFTPLLECKKLRDLNMCWTDGDPEVIAQLTWLERLWFPGHNLSKDAKQAIVDALPNTEVYMPEWDKDGSTGGGWREADIYFEMRNLFGMFYQPGGTGMNNN
jgi:hypothetical protein